MLRNNFIFYFRRVEFSYAYIYVKMSLLYNSSFLGEEIQSSLLCILVSLLMNHFLLTPN